MRDYFSSAYFLLATFLALQTRFTVRYCKKVKMGVRGIYRLMMLIMSVAIVAFAAIAYVNWVAMREENAERDMVRQKLFDHVQKLKADKEYKTQYFYRLLHDEKFAERIIREKLGFVGKDEIVFRFEDSNPVGVEIVPKQAKPQVKIREEIRSKILRRILSKGNCTDLNRGNRCCRA
ncbi:MAG: FtsB family cell division protein [Bacilli bacterium]